MTRRFSHPLVLSLALTGLVFAIDLALPLGVASAVPYTFAVLLALADRRAWCGPAVAVLCGVLTVAKMELVPDRGTTEEWKVIANRGLAIFAVGMTTVLGVLRKRAIAAKERTEAVLRARQADLAHIGRLSMLGQVAAGLAHELNQPLAAIGLNAEIAARLAGEDNSTDLLDSLREIREQSARAGEIIRGVRRLARRGTPGTDPVAVDEIVASAVALLEWQAQRAGVAVRVTRGGPAAVVAADRLQVEQVMVNLLQNAFDATADQSGGSPAVAVTVGTDSEFVTVCVRDTGRGGFDATRLFEPFYTTKAGGLGLGLAISRGIVEAHGGRLWATPVEGGTKFAFRLPKARDDQHGGGTDDLCGG